MTSAAVVQKIINHPDKDELISKLATGVLPTEINEWLSFKYSSLSDKKLVLSTKQLQSFKDDYLDVYTVIREDFQKARGALAISSEDSLELSVAGNSAYKKLVMDTVGKELNLKETIRSIAHVIETRLAQIFDVIQEDPRNINGRIDRILIEYIDKFAIVLEKAHKFENESPDQVIQHNITVQHIDQHTTIFYEAIKRVLSKMDLQSSMYFMEAFNEEMNKIKSPQSRAITPVDERIVEVKILNEVINQKVNS